jgi:hypothetical protein
MKCLSIRQPWAWLIVNGHKDVENRTRRTNYRGTVLVHAGQEPFSKYDLLEHEIFTKRHVLLPLQKYQPVGGIVGIAEIVDCVTASDSPWFEGPFGILLRDARPLPFTPLRGRLGLFEVPEEVVKQLHIER